MTVSATGTAIGEKEMDKSDAMMESVEFDLNKQLKPRGFAPSAAGASIFDSSPTGRPASSPNHGSWQTKVLSPHSNGGGPANKN